MYQTLINSLLGQRSFEEAKKFVRKLMKINKFNHQVYLQMGAIL
jgi:pentatricopeptide repeat protein